MKRAFLGMGLLGSNFVKAMLKQGKTVTVWNRTASKAEVLSEFGAAVVTNLSDAVKDADLIHMVLKDDASVNELLSKAESSLKPGAIILDHTTTSVNGAKERTASWNAKGFSYQHAPVMMGPKNALESTGRMLVSGDQALISKMHDELAAMTGDLINCGEEVGKAAAFKLVSNLFLLAVNAGWSDVFSFCKSTGISRNEIRKFVGTGFPEQMTRGGFAKMLLDEFQNATWELPMARKDAQLMMNEVDHAGNTMIAIPALAKEMDRWIENGHQHDDWTVFASENIVN